MSEDLTWIRDGIEAPLKQRIAELEAEVERLRGEVLSLDSSSRTWHEVARKESTRVEKLHVQLDAAREVARLWPPPGGGRQLSKALDRLVEVVGEP